MHVRVAYTWGLVGTILASTYSLSGYRLNLYDSCIHALTVGFVGTMMLGHGPVILPAVIRRRFREEKLAFMPLGVLSLAVFLRVLGELVRTLLVLKWAPRGIVIGLSGWLVVAAVLLFLQLIAIGIKETTNIAKPEPTL